MITIAVQPGRRCRIIRQSLAVLPVILVVTGLTPLRGDDQKMPPPKARDGVFTVPEDPPDYVKYISVSGRAVDPEGQPLAGATIYLSSYRPGYKLLAETKTDPEGRYRFERVLLPVAAERAGNIRESGEFEVFGLAEGYAIAWRIRSIYYPQGKPKRPAGIIVENDYQHFEPGDPIELDLRFVKPHPIQGRIVDDEGTPLEGVEVNVRYCDTRWDKPNFNSIGFEGFLHAFNESKIIPRDVKIQTTDAEGRFAFGRLPPDLRWSLWLRRKGLPTRRVWIVSRDGEPLQRDDQTIHFTNAEITFERTVTIPVRVVHGDSGEGARDVLVELGGQFGSSAGYTDADGRLTLDVPPGEFRVHIAPAYRTPYWVTDGETALVERIPEQPLRTFTLDPAATVEVQFLDVDTDAPVAGVRLWRALLDRNPDRGEPRAGPHEYRSIERATRISHVNRIVSNEQGLLRTFFKPGKYRIKADAEELPGGYVPVDDTGETYNLAAGEPTRITLYMRKTPR